MMPAGWGARRHYLFHGTATHLAGAGELRAKLPVTPQGTCQPPGCSGREHPENVQIGPGRAVTQTKRTSFSPSALLGARVSYALLLGAGLSPTIQWYIPEVCFGVTLTAVIGGDQWRGARER